MANQPRLLTSSNMGYTFTNKYPLLRAFDSISNGGTHNEMEEKKSKFREILPIIVPQYKGSEVIMAESSREPFALQYRDVVEQK